jgi:hypothetical protein
VALKTLLAYSASILVVIGLAGFALFKWSANIRNVLGIRKDLLDVKKAKRELDKDDARIRLATDEEIRSIDPKWRILDYLGYSNRTLGGGGFPRIIGPMSVALAIFLTLLFNKSCWLSMLPRNITR